MQLEAELVEIDEELRGIEDEIGALLMRQSELMERKSQIQEIMAAGDPEAAGDGNHGSGSASCIDITDWKDQFAWTEDVHRILTQEVHAYDTVHKPYLHHWTNGVIDLCSCICRPFGPSKKRSSMRRCPRRMSS
jgi:hypothetical protein